MKFRPFLSVVLFSGALLSVQAQAIVGAWSYGDTLTPDADGTGVFIFFDNGAYFRAESDNTNDAANGKNGMERGTYTWNAGTDAFSATTIVDNDGTWGLSGGSPGFINVSGDTMTVDGDFTLSRVTSAGSIVGAWSYGDTLNPGSEGTGVLVFMSNGVYFQIESENVADAANGPANNPTDSPGGVLAGIERGTYTWDGSLLTVGSVFVDTNGSWGFSSDVGVPLSLTISGDIMTVDGDSMLSRVVAVPEPSIWALMLSGSAMAGLAAWRRRCAA